MDLLHEGRKCRNPIFKNAELRTDISPITVYCDAFFFLGALARSVLNEIGFVLFWVTTHRRNFASLFCKSPKVPEVSKINKANVDKNSQNTFSKNGIIQKMQMIGKKIS